MSKAFTKEGDEGEEALPDYQPPWPPGSRNYVTPAGYARLRAERESLLAQIQAPEAKLPAAAGTTREARRRLAIVGQHLDAAEIVEPVSAPTQVQFGTTVKVSGERERSYSIVGVDEVDAASGRVSWLSPIARALLGRKVGDQVVLRSPRGEEDVVVVAVTPLA